MSPTIRLLPDIRSFWEYADATQRLEETPDGPAAEAEERRDLRAAEAVEEVLEALIGPEGEKDSAQCQHWDWNDDATRPVYILSSAFQWQVLPDLQAVLVGEFADFRVLIMLQDTWLSEIWGGAVVTRDAIVVQKAVFERYGLAA